MNRTYHPRGVLVDGYRVRQHPSYATWFLMWSRCTSPSATGYENYGGRGIGVCVRWHHFRNFAADMGVRPSKLHSIERMDNDEDYSPGNCVWALREQQNANKRVYKTSTTGASGVRLRDGKYQVRVIENGKRKSIGNFATLEEAIAARTQRIGEQACHTQG